MANFPGINGNDNLVGTADADTFNISLGGTDVVSGAAGNDVIIAGAAFDALDQISGGQGNDRLELTGNYAAGIVFNATTLQRVEEIRFGAGFDYNLTSHDNTVAAGATLKLDAYFNGIGHSVTFDGSAETNGSFLYYDGTGTDNVTTGAGNDSFVMGYGGTDTVHAGAGGDAIYTGGAFDVTDVFDGGAGDNDGLYMSGNYAMTINGTMMQNVESLILHGNFTIGLTVTDNVVGAGKNLYVTAEGMSGTGIATFNGSAETDGTFSFKDGINNDNFSGGQNSDTFWNFNGGSDIFQGQGGSDTFFMYDNLDASDTVLGGAGKDWVVLSGDYSAGVTLDMFTLSSIEALSTYDGFDYKVTTDDATVGPGKAFEVTASYLSSAHHIDFDGTAETDGSFNFYGGAGDDVFRGGAGKDYLDAHNGGNDSFYGAGDNDHVSFFNAYTTADFFDGGAGVDSVYLYGDFAGGLTLDSNQFQNVESITFGPGHSYEVTILDSMVAAGKSLAVDTYWSEAGENFSFGGSSETDGAFRMTGGNGDDQLNGGAMNDIFYLNRGGNDVMNGNAGSDIFYVGDGFAVDDQMNGGTGSDQVRFSTDIAGKVTFLASTFTSIEKFDFFYGRSYNVASNDAMVDAGQTLSVDGRFMAANETLKFDGAAETDGSFAMIAGAGADILIGGALADSFNGGAGNDTIKGNAGNDQLTGGLGTDQLWGGVDNDTFTFKAVAEIGTGAAADAIRDWNAGDIIDLSAIDTSLLAGDQAFTFIGSAGFSGAGQIRVVDNGTATFVRGDVDGDGTVDFQIALAGVHTLGAGDFIL